MGIRARFLMPNRGGADYRAKVLRHGPIGYWMLAEGSGAAARCQVDAAQNGTHTGVTLAQPGIGDGEPCPLYDGINDYTDIYSATLAGVFNGAEGTVLVWAKVSGVGVWTDGITRTAVGLGYDDTTNYIQIYRRSVDYNLVWAYEAGDVLKQVVVGGLSDIDWMPLAITWSKTADQMKAYKDGAQIGSTGTGLGVWAGALSSTRTIVGESLSTGATPWDGWLAHCAVWDRPLTPTEIRALAAF